MKKYLVDIGMGALAGVICFLVGFVASAFSRELIYYVLISLILIVISAPIYLKTGVYKKNHAGAASISAIILFLVGAIIAYAAIFYFALGISFSLSGPTIL